MVQAREELLLGDAFRAGALAEGVGGERADFVGVGIPERLLRGREVEVFAQLVEGDFERGGLGVDAALARGCRPCLPFDFLRTARWPRPPRRRARGRARVGG